MQERLKNMEEMQYVKDMMESEDEEESKKPFGKGNRYIEKEEYDENKMDNSFGNTSFTK